MKNFIQTSGMMMACWLLALANWMLPTAAQVAGVPAIVRNTGLTVLGNGTTRTFAVPVTIPGSFFRVQISP